MTRVDCGNIGCDLCRDHFAAQGIEARSDKTRSGLAEGKSPVRKDAPNG